MYGKVLFVVGGLVGYVIGTKQGREGYEKLKRQATDLWENPKVQRTVSDAQKFAEDKIPGFSNLTTLSGVVEPALIRKVLLSPGPSVGRSNVSPPTSSL